MLIDDWFADGLSGFLKPGGENRNIARQQWCNGERGTHGEMVNVAPMWHPCTQQSLNPGFCVGATSAPPNNRI
jgi:hypothetical protein